MQYQVFRRVSIIAWRIEDEARMLPEPITPEGACRRNSDCGPCAVLHPNGLVTSLSGRVVERTYRYEKAWLQDCCTRGPWRCMGDLGAFAEKVRATGMCVATDLGGDQIVGDFVASPVPMSDKERRGKFEFVGGTGKYVGITGEFTYINYPYEMPYPELAAANHYAAHNTYQGTYKLP